MNVLCRVLSSYQIEDYMYLISKHMNTLLGYGIGMDISGLLRSDGNKIP